MTNKTTSWMDQAGDLYKQWADQQQALFRSMSLGSAPPGLPGALTANAPAGASEGMRQAQALWQSSMEQWVTLAQQALPQSGITAESLKTLFDPSQWAQAGLGPLDAAIEHLVEGPSYATLWTLDRKALIPSVLPAGVTAPAATWPLSALSSPGTQAFHNSQCSCWSIHALLPMRNVRLITSVPRGICLPVK